jgi:hypothetical protein
LTLLHTWYFRTLDLGFHIVDGVGRLHLEGDSLAREGLDENLHGDLDDGQYAWMGIFNAIRCMLCSLPQQAKGRMSLRSMCRNVM